MSGLVLTLIVLGVLAVLILISFAQFNRLRAANIAVDEALGQVDVQLKRRSDLIPNLVETVRGYAAHERGTFEEVTRARSAMDTAHSVGELAQADNMLTSALRSLFAVAEQYPDLKASANFQSLQEELATTENKIAFARQYYNDRVRILNTAVSTLPGLFFTSVAKVGQREFYEVDSPEQRQAPQVTFPGP
ncbi:MAG: LemA family protein [Actinomycetales bacterium]|nr:LemA family protein [Actinomycetales bacterium]